MSLIPVPNFPDMPNRWSRWHSLTDLEVVPNGEWWGLYAFRVSEQTIIDDVPADPLEPDVKIIGETSGATTTLFSRTYAARQVLKGKKASHGPAWTLRGLLGGPRPDLTGIFVAFYPVWVEDAARSAALVLALERIVLYNYVHVHGGLPLANSE